MTSSPLLWGAFIVAVVIMNTCTTQEFNVTLSFALLTWLGNYLTNVNFFVNLCQKLVNIATVVTLAFENGMYLNGTKARITTFTVN